MYAFEFVKPSTLAEAVAALAAEDAQALGGGQTLIPTLKQRLASPGTRVSLSGIAERRRVFTDRGGRLVVGGGTTHAQVAREAAGSYPALAALASRIGDPAVRNRGTIGGSLANNDPSADYLEETEHALFVQAHDPEAIAHGLQRLLTEPSLLAAMRQANRRLSRRFDRQRVAADFAAIYQELHRDSL
jgi:glycosyltransferase involved in cell wall biosynthesis